MTITKIVYLKLCGVLEKKEATKNEYKKVLEAIYLEWEYIGRSKSWLYVKSVKE